MNYLYIIFLYFSLLPRCSRENDDKELNFPTFCIAASVDVGFVGSRPLPPAGVYANSSWSEVNSTLSVYGPM